jgi:septal ring factor EnvC (AmiA/AmiB activator)
LKGEIKKLQIELRDRRQQITALERDVDDTEKDITRLEGEKSRVQARSRALENELRITKAQVDELLSTNLDNENAIRMKVISSILQSNYRTRKSPCFKRPFNNVLPRSQASLPEIIKQ